MISPIDRIRQETLLLKNKSTYGMDLCEILKEIFEATVKASSRI